MAHSQKKKKSIEYKISRNDKIIIRCTLFMIYYRMSLMKNNLAVLVKLSDNYLCRKSE